jgi:hypothetical protein
MAHHPERPQRELQRFRAALEGDRSWTTFAETLDEHFLQLSPTVAQGCVEPEPSIRAAARSFVRPHGPALGPEILLSRWIVRDAMKRRRRTAALDGAAGVA